MRIRAFCSLMLASSLAAVAGPVILFDSFGAGQTFDTMAAYSLGGSNDYSQAAVFTPGVTATLYQIDLPLSYVTSGDAVVWLTTSVDGRPGAVLEEFTITGIGYMPRVFSLMSVTHPLMTAGTQYWIAAHDTAGSGGRVAWYFSTSATGLVTTRYGSNPWESPTTRALPAFDVLGEALPEPTSLAMLALGALTVLGRRALRIGRR